MTKMLHVSGLGATMSKRIDDAIDVLHAVRQAIEGDGAQTWNVRQLRIQAVKDVAATRGVTPQDIADVYIRRLAPYVRQTAHFDALVTQWLHGHSIELKAALEKSSLDAGDRGRIKAFFEANQMASRVRS